MFVLATESDHIAPRRSVYNTALFTDCDLSFVLTKGGHNSGILSEPGHPGRHYHFGRRPSGALYVGPDASREAQAPQPGSWWPEWADWLSSRSGELTDPPAMGAADRGYPPVGAAPGTFIHQP